MSNKRFIIQRFRFPKILTCQGFDLSRGRGNETSTNIVWYLYSFRALFVLYEAVLDNKYILLDVLVCSIAVYFYESCSILASPKGESKYKWWVKIYSDTTH